MESSEFFFSREISNKELTMETACNNYMTEIYQISNKDSEKNLTTQEISFSFTVTLYAEKSQLIL